MRYILIIRLIRLLNCRCRCLFAFCGLVGLLVGCGGGEPTQTVNTVWAKDKPQQTRKDNIILRMVYPPYESFVLSKDNVMDNGASSRDDTDCVLSDADNKAIVRQFSPAIKLSPRGGVIAERLNDGSTIIAVNSCKERIESEDGNCRPIFVVLKNGKALVQNSLQKGFPSLGYVQTRGRLGKLLGEVSYNECGIHENTPVNCKRSNVAMAYRSIKYLSGATATNLIAVVSYNAHAGCQSGNLDELYLFSKNRWHLVDRAKHLGDAFLAVESTQSKHFALKNARVTETCPKEITDTENESPCFDGEFKRKRLLIFDTELPSISKLKQRRTIRDLPLDMGERAWIFNFESGDTVVAAICNMEFTEVSGLCIQRFGNTKTTDHFQLLTDLDYEYDAAFVLTAQDSNNLELQVHNTDLVEIIKIHFENAKWSVLPNDSNNTSDANSNFAVDNSDAHKEDSAGEDNDAENKGGKNDIENINDEAFESEYQPSCNDLTALSQANRSNIASAFRLPIPEESNNWKHSFPSVLFDESQVFVDTLCLEPGAQNHRCLYVNRPMETPVTLDTVCQGISDADCKRSRFCSQNGLCSEKQNRCVARSKALCKKSYNCKASGKCTLHKDKCVTQTDADCKNADGCKYYGRCTAQNGNCVVAKRNDCKRSSLCSQKGLCDFLNGTCQASSDEDCRQSSICTKRFQCAAVNGKCGYGSDQDCAKTLQCTQDGQCSAQNGECIAASNEDCKNAGICLNNKKCFAAEGKCHTQKDAWRPKNAEDCKRLAGCKKQGRCSWVNGACAAAASQDCTASELCKKLGKCTVKDGQCIVGSSKDCKRSALCSRYKAQCSHLNGQCVVQSDADCKTLTACTWDGRCTFAKGKCIVARQSDCEASRGCKDFGVCKLNDGECVKSDKGCRQSEMCTYWGQCSYHKDHYMCIATKEIDCQNADLCHEESQCTLRDNKCLLE